MKYYFKGAEILAPFTITSNAPVYDVDTVSLKKQRASQNAQRWELSFEVVIPENPADIFVSGLEGFDSTETMVMPQFKQVYEATTVSTSPKTIGTAQSGTSSVTVDVSTASGLIPKGSFIKFSNHDKIYVVTADIDCNLQSDFSASIYPSLVTQVPTETFIHVGDSCVITYYRDVNNLQGITFSDGILSSPGTINLIEAL